MPALPKAKVAAIKDLISAGGQWLAVVIAVGRTMPPSLGDDARAIINKESANLTAKIETVVKLEE